MSGIRTNALLVPNSSDPRQGEAVLSHLAARLSARFPRYLENVANTEISVESSIGVAPFGEWSKPGARPYQIGSSSVIIVRVDERLAGMLLEYQLGGQTSSRSQPNGMQGRATASLMQSIANTVSVAVADGWPGGGVARYAPTDDGAQLARSDDEVATVTLAISSDGTMIGQIGIAFPVEGLARVSGPPAAPRDGDWCARLRESVLAARLPVRAILARPELPAAIVMRLAVGDVLPISRPGTVPLYSGDYLVGSGTIVEITGRTAVQFKMTEPCND
jgi:flagellar motor switch protein FliM